MPVLREAKPKAKSDLDILAERQVEDMLESVGIGPRAVAAKDARRRALLAIDRPLTDDEQDELDALIIERRGERWHSKHFGALVDKAEAEWAEQSSDPEFVARWERYALEHKAANGKPGEPKWEHWYWTITHSKEAKRIDREARRYDRIVDRLRRRIDKRAKAREAAANAALEPADEVVLEQPAPPRAEVATPPAAPEPAPRRRSRAGVAWVEDAHGNRVG